MRFALALAGVALSLSSLPAAAQQGKPQQHVRGDVVGVKGNTVDVRTRAGQVVHLNVPDHAAIAEVEEADPSAIADGAFVGTTAVPQPDGTLRAIEVHVFPEAMRGAGEGNRPWDLRPGSSMTNATVSGMSGGKQSAAGKGTGSSMTNATVAGMKNSGAARTLQLEYQGGKQTVVVPAGIPIVRLSPGDRSLLKPGAHVFAITTQQEDGSLLAERLTVGQGAVVPPM